MLPESDRIVCSQVLCLLPLILMNSCQSMDKMSSMPTVAKTWGIWTPTSSLWRKKPTSRWPGKNHLRPEVFLGSRGEGRLCCFCSVVGRAVLEWRKHLQNKAGPGSLSYLSFFPPSFYACGPRPARREQ